MTKAVATIPLERVEQAILAIRDHKVILDSDLATLYDTNTRLYRVPESSWASWSWTPLRLAARYSETRCFLIRHSSPYTKVDSTVSDWIHVRDPIGKLHPAER